MLTPSFMRIVATVSKRKITRSFATLPPEVVIFPDPVMIVCWHPKQHFPYEFTKPLPEPKERPFSVLKIERNEVKKMFARKRKVDDAQTAMELAKMTYTTKHRWFPRSRDREAKKTQPDRPYL